MNISIHSISNKLGIDRKIIKYWIKNEINLNNIPNKDRRYCACKSSGIIKDFSDGEEEKIFIWIREKRDNKYPVSAKSILAFASSLKNSFSYKKIDAQMRWVYRFIRRYGLSIRRISHIGQMIPENKNLKKMNFINEVTQKKRTRN